MFPTSPLEASAEQFGEVAHRLGTLFGSAAYVHAMTEGGDAVDMDVLIAKLADPKAHGLDLGASVIQGVKLRGIDVGSFVANQGLALVAFQAKSEEFKKYIPPYVYVAVPTQVWREFAQQVIASYRQVCARFADVMTIANDQAKAALGDAGYSEVLGIEDEPTGPRSDVN